jgi:polar amino acid transport system substrate-binding protein
MQVATSNFETATKILGEERIQGFQQFDFAVQALIGGDIEGVIIDDVAGQGYIGQNADKVKLVGDCLSSDALGFIYPNGSDLREPVDKALRAMMSDGFLDKVNKQYFGPDFTITYDDIGPGAYAEEECFLFSFF